MFTASYTAMSLSGLCNLHVPTFPKSNAEIEPVVGRFKEVRVNAGQPKLKRYESDGGGNKLLWEKIFRDDLKEGMNPYTPTMIDGHIRAMLEMNQYCELSSIGAVEDWVGSVFVYLEHHPDKVIHYALDEEWNALNGTHDITRLLSLAMPTLLSVLPVAINLGRLCAFTPETFPEPLRALLQRPRLVPVGINIAGDIARLAKLGVHIRKW